MNNMTPAETMEFEKEMNEFANERLHLVMSDEEIYNYLKYGTNDVEDDKTLNITYDVINVYVNSSIMTDDDIARADNEIYNLTNEIWNYQTELSNEENVEDEYRDYSKVDYLKETLDEHYNELITYLDLYFNFHIVL